jgi:hypothetical protein
MVIFQSVMKLMIRGSASVTSSLQSKIEQAVFFGERSDVSRASRVCITLTIRIHYPSASRRMWRVM